MDREDDDDRYVEDRYFLPNAKLKMAKHLEPDRPLVVDWKFLLVIIFAISYIFYQVLFS